jgi:hypothetical protein
MTNERNRNKENIRHRDAVTPAEEEPTFDATAVRDGQLAYVQENWEILAAIAWKQYLEEGRSALVMYPEGPTGWFGICVTLQKFQVKPDLSEYADRIRLYDPGTQIVTIFYTPRNYIGAYIRHTPRGQLRPPDAFRKIGSLLVRN